MNLAADRLLDRQLGPYKIVEAIGQGGMARVYKGYHEDLARYAAIKVIAWGLVEDQEFTSRFRREAQAIASLRHPHIVTIYDFGKYEHGYYLVMEYIDGQDLETLIARGEPLPPATIQSIITQIAEALDYTHSHNVIHRDVKPSNIMIAKEGEAILTDFGLVMLPNSRGNTTLGNSFGTPYYMAPEQATSSAAAVPASDIYSLGVILFELIAGMPPYVADSPLGVALKHVSEPIPNIQDFAPETPDEVRAVIERAMAKEVSERFATASDMARALVQAWNRDGIQSTPAPIMPPPISSSVQTATFDFPTNRPPIHPVSSRSIWSKQPQFIVGVLIVLLLMILSVGVGLNLRQSQRTPVSKPVQTQAQVVAAAATPTPTVTPGPATATSASDSQAGAVITSTLEATATFTSTPLSTPMTIVVPTDTPTITPTFTPTPTATPSPTATTVPVPTETPTLTPEPTNTPTTEELLTSLRGQILFKTDRSGRVEIYQMSPDGSDQKPLGVDLAYLYNEAIRWETFSPDRTRTVVVRGEGQLDLWHVNLAEGGDLRITSNPAADYDPVWSPVDDRIVFVSERTGNGDLYMLDLNGSGEFRLTTNEADFDKHPSWSPDGKKIVYWSNQGWQKNPQIWLLDLETLETISLSNNPFKDWDPVWVK
jgi:serine/threonine protein kinase